MYVFLIIQFLYNDTRMHYIKKIIKNTQDAYVPCFRSVKLPELRAFPGAAVQCGCTSEFAADLMEVNVDVEVDIDGSGGK